MLNEPEVRNLLTPFGLTLTSAQICKLLTYLDLLLYWNRKINLTAIRTASDCVTRHFGESLYLASCVELRGDLLDIGSGAGFPGLALKIAFPRLATTLLEPVAKKRTFLKEVARACGMDSVQVRGERLADFLRQNPNAAFANATSRGLGRPDKLIPLAVRALRSGGQLFLWATHKDTDMLVGQDMLEWGTPIVLPLSRIREIWVGTSKST